MLAVILKKKPFLSILDDGNERILGQNWVLCGLQQTVFFSKTLLLLVSGYSFLIWGYFLSAGRALDDGTCHGTAECHSVQKPSSYGLWKKTRVDYAQGGPVPVLSAGITTINGPINGQLGLYPLLSGVVTVLITGRRPPCMLC